MGMLRSEKRFQIVTGPGKTQQHLRDLSSPRRLMEKYGAKRLVEALALAPKTFSDMPPVDDYKEALDLITRSSAAFAILPSTLRNRFENDPVKLCAFLNDASNREEAIELGLINRPAVTDEAERKDVKKPDINKKPPAKKGPEDDDN